MPAEIGATKPTVVAGLGYPNGRVELSPVPTGWQASKVLFDGSADQTKSDVSNVGHTQTKTEI